MLLIIVVGIVVSGINVELIIFGIVVSGIVVELDAFIIVVGFQSLEL